MNPLTNSALTEEEYKVLIKYIYSICGITLNEDKKYLIHQRLEPLAESMQCSMSELVRKIAATPDFHLRDKIIIAITTNETFFFRDIHPFETFRQFMLPKLAEKIRERKLRMPEAGIQSLYLVVRLFHRAGALQPFHDYSRIYPVQ